MPLVNGRIPAREDCPYRSKCQTAHNGDCKHKGAELQLNDFSCASARYFALVEKNNRRFGQNFQNQLKEQP